VVNVKQKQTKASRRKSVISVQKKNKNRLFVGKKKLNSMEGKKEKALPYLGPANIPATVRY